MALTNGANTTDRITIAPSASLNGLAATTLLLWIQISTLTNTRTLWGKLPLGTFNGFLRFSGTSGDLQWSHRRTGNAFTYTTNNTPLSTLNKWYCVAATYDLSLGASVAHVYVGSLTAALVESTYSTSTQGSGTCDTADTTDSTQLLNTNEVGTSRALQGVGAHFMQWNRALSKGELLDQQFYPHVSNGCVVFMPLGFNGTSTQPDWSGNGNVGTVTGSTVSAHVPLGPIFARPRASAYTVFNGALGAGFWLPQPCPSTVRSVVSY